MRRTSTISRIGAGLGRAQPPIRLIPAGNLADRIRRGQPVTANLLISAKTVETNLSRVHRKLGVRSRAGLSAALASSADNS